MKYFKNLKTSDRISIIFSIFNFVSLLILLISINIIYFFIWYTDQKEESLFDMNKSYSEYSSIEEISETEAFRSYILQKNTLIIPEDGGELICSEGVTKMVHEDIDALKDKVYYKTGDKSYLVFSRSYDGIGEVKVLFDTTSYIKSQIIIIKISLFIILVFIVISFLFGKIVSRYALKNLQKICQKAKNISLDNFSEIKIDGPENDEIRILSETINDSYKKIESQTRVLKQFITDVSHEFKTPLMIINSKIDVYNKRLEKGKLTLEQHRQVLNELKEATTRLNSILETLFVLSRIEEGITCFRTEKTDIGKYLKNLSENLIGSYQGKKFDLVFNLKDNLIKEIDKSTFNIIVYNLLSNAIKFSSTEPIKIEIGLDDNSFWIRDFGTGISEKEQMRVWKKFYRSDTNLEGFGVGLFIVKRIVGIYGWSIELGSKEGKGAKFIVNF